MLISAREGGRKEEYYVKGFSTTIVPSKHPWVLENSQANLGVSSYMEIGTYSGQCGKHRNHIIVNYYFRL